MSNIPRNPVTSSNIVSVGYDPGSQTLAVEFKSGVYHYHGVPPEAHADLMGSDSIGAHLAANIKGTYDHTKIG